MAFLRRKPKLHLAIPLNLNGTFSTLCSPDFVPVQKELITAIEANVTCERCLALLDKYDAYFDQALAGLGPDAAAS